MTIPANRIASNCQSNLQEDGALRNQKPLLLFEKRHMFILKRDIY